MILQIDRISCIELFEYAVDTVRFGQGRPGPADPIARRTGLFPWHLFSS